MTHKKKLNVGNYYKDYGNTLDFIRPNLFAFHTGTYNFDKLIMFVQIQDLQYFQIDPINFDLIPATHPISTVNFIVPYSTNLDKKPQALTYDYPTSYAQICNDTSVIRQSKAYHHITKKQLFFTMYRILTNLSK